MSHPTAFDLPSFPSGPIPDPLSSCMQAIVRDDGRLFLALLNPYEPGPIREALSAARLALAVSERYQQALLQELSPASTTEIVRQLELLIRAFPAPSSQDLAGYGAQLGEDVAEMRPSRRALHEACRMLRRTKRFMPAICEIIEAINDADGKLRALTRHLTALPDRIAYAESVLAIRTRPPRACSQSQRAAAQ